MWQRSGFALTIVLGLTSLAATAPAIAAGLTPTGLRCDLMTDPLGVDSASPRLSWQLTGDGSHGQRQTAWQIIVASTRDGLAAGRGDIWDSGRVESAEQLHVPFAGRPLRLGEPVHWQVRVWDETGRVSAWSGPAAWTMGLLAAEAWSAHWITDPDLLQRRRSHLGYSSLPTPDVNTVKWIQLDLGTALPIDAVRLHALVHSVPERLGFPARFKVEVSADAAFRQARLIADYTAQDFPDDWARLVTLPAASVNARYVRITAPRLRLTDGLARLAFSQIEVIATGKNVAPGATVTASDSLESTLWSAAAVVDGLGVPGSNPRANSTLLLRREFSVRPPLRRALLHVSGLGQYRLFLNGRNVTENLLTPGWTDYAKTVFYDTYDVTNRLHNGPNAIGLMLAGGMYNVQPGLDRYVKFAGAFRPLMAIAQLKLEYVDGTSESVDTDASWRVASGPVTYANIYGGEDFDARLWPEGWNSAPFDDSRWTPAVEADGPGGTLQGASHASPAFRTFETLEPVSTRELRPGVTVYDLGQNASLMLRFSASGEAGARAKIIPAELLKPDGSVDRQSVGGGEASWNYTFRGNSPAGESWQPEFFYHGARYLQVELLPANEGGPLPASVRIAGLVAHSDSAPAGEFACSSELFNRIHTLVRWAQRSNLAHVITDCPHRERLGWLEQYHLNGPALRYEFDLGRLFAKTFGDMASAQAANGLIPSIAPDYVVFNGGFRDSPEWGSALILAAWQQYVWTGDDTALRRHYTAMQRYVDYLASRAADGIVSHGLGDWYDLGPRSPGVAQLTPVPLTATAFYFLSTETLARISAHLGQTIDATRYSAQAVAIKEAFNREFFDAEKDTYATGSQTAHALPLVLDLVPAEHRAAVLDHLVADVRAHGNAFTAGDVGYRFLLRALADGGRSDLIYAMNAQSDKPGYGYQLARGATSLTEAWDAAPQSSQNHFMLGQIVEWFYADLAGLAPDPAAPGFSRVIIRPQPVAGIDWARARHESPRGPVTVSWQRREGEFTLQIDLPPNTEATVILPQESNGPVTESGRPVWEKPAIRSVPAAPGQPACFAVGSGHYEFQVHLP